MATIVDTVTPPTEEQIREMVHRFYQSVRNDGLLGPVFNEHIEDWPDHLEKMCRFWNTVLLGARSYQGDPMRAHLALPGVESRHFDRWLELFATTLGEIFEPGTAQMVYDRASKMRRALETAIQRHREGRTDLFDRPYIRE